MMGMVQFPVLGSVSQTVAYVIFGLAFILVLAIVIAVSKRRSAGGTQRTVGEMLVIAGIVLIFFSLLSPIVRLVYPSFSAVKVGPLFIILLAFAGIVVIYQVALGELKTDTAGIALIAGILVLVVLGIIFLPKLVPQLKELAIYGQSLMSAIR